MKREGKRLQKLFRFKLEALHWHFIQAEHRQWLTFSKLKPKFAIQRNEIHSEYCLLEIRMFWLIQMSDLGIKLRIGNEIMCDLSCFFRDFSFSLLRSSRSRENDSSINCFTQEKKIHLKFRKVHNNQWRRYWLTHFVYLLLNTWIIWFSVHFISHLHKTNAVISNNF